MDKKVFTELCKEEDILVEKLRLLREFKAKFFAEHLSQEEVLVNQSAFNQKTASFPGTPTKRAPNRGSKKLTVAHKVINALSAIGSGGSRAVADKMIELYPSDYRNKHQKAIGDARYQISDLVRDGKVEVESQGVGKSGSVYRIKVDTADNL